MSTDYSYETLALEHALDKKLEAARDTVKHLKIIQLDTLARGLDELSAIVNLEIIRRVGKGSE